LKSILVILVILFFVLTPAHAQLLSDTTGLINRLEIQTSGHTFEIKLTSNFDVDDFIFDKSQKQLSLYFESSLENNLGEIIIPKTLLSGDLTFYLNDKEFFPKIRTNEIIHFITLEFSGSGTNVVKIFATEYLSGLDEIIPIEDEIPDAFNDADFLSSDGQSTDMSSNDYLIWLIVGGIVVIIAVFAVTKFLKNKN
jgi:hypothetical protein